MTLRMGVGTLHIDGMLESVDFLLIGGNFSIAAASALVTSLDLCIVGEGGVVGFYYVVLS